MDNTFEFVGYDENLGRGDVSFKYSLSTPKETFNFTEKLIFPLVDLKDIPEELIKRFLDSLLLVLGISYWKLYCPEKVNIGPIKLSQKQADFWNDLYINGLGEFFYQNNIDFRKFNLFTANSGETEPIAFERKDRALLPIGGGKDSIVSAELLKKSGKEIVAFTLGESEIQNNIIELLEVEKIVVKRVLDPLLFELNAKGAFNGHIPISAIYHFVGVFAALLFDFKYVIFSNEASANYGNVEYLGKEINHQWSKSLEFEKLFQSYIKNLTAGIKPLSLLRSMNEIKITELFSKNPEYFPVFSSCNRNFKINKKSGFLWCGGCAKCLFVFAMLSAFVSKDELVKIFGKNLFDDKNLADKYLELLGVKNHKPFDCVGTPEEVRLAFYLAGEKGEYREDSIMQIFYKNFSNELESIKESEKNLLGLNSMSEEIVLSI